MEWTCKPNSVPRTEGRGKDHSSATRVAAVVKQPTRKLITETGGSMTSLFGLAPQGVCRAAPTRVGRGALLPHRFTLASSSNLAVSRRSAVCSLLHFPSRRRAWPLASLLPVRVRTFLDALRRRDLPVHSTRRRVTVSGLGHSRGDGFARRWRGAEKMIRDKLLLFQSLTIDVGVPTSKYIPVFRV